MSELADRREPELIGSFWTLAGPSYFEDGVGSSPKETSPWDLRDRIEAAARAGWVGVGLTHQDLDYWARRYSAQEIRSMLEANGIVHVELEMLFDWFTDGERRASADQSRQRLMWWAGELGARHIKTGTDLGGEDPEIYDRLVSEFARVCDDASAVGTRIALEPVLPGKVTTPAEGLALIDAAGAANAGLLIDIWHIARAKLPYSELSSIPGERIVTVELCDGTREAHGEWLEETLDRRLSPGDGEFDVPEFIRAIAATGYDGPFGVEIISVATRAQTLEQSATSNFAAASQQLKVAAAGV